MTTTQKTTQPNHSLEELVALCKRRGFIYQSSTIYGGLAGVHDYGPMGSLLRDNIVASWKKKFVQDRTDMFQFNAGILMSRKVWETSGHIDKFVDPMTEDTKTNKRYRADHLLEDAGISPEGMTIDDMVQAIHEHDIKSPDGNPLGPVRNFQMMLSTTVGPMQTVEAETFLRPETAQGMFVNFKNVVDSFSPKLPFGMAQVGKAFRNEITPKNFLFRGREFEQMEIEYFVKEQDWDRYFEYWLQEQYEWLEEVGVETGRLVQYEQTPEDRAHYSKRGVDYEFNFPFGVKELTGLAYRTDYDLSKHAAASGEKLHMRDEETNEIFTPHVIEPTFGLDRVVLAVLSSAYEVEDLGEGKSRVVLKLAPHIAPFKAAVSPLLKNKPELVEKAREVFGRVKSECGYVMWDDHGNIGKRYRRQDEIGTPFCIVIDHDTLEDGTVTIRNRDTMEQVRMSVEEVVKHVKETTQT